MNETIEVPVFCGNCGKRLKSGIRIGRGVEALLTDNHWKCGDCGHTTTLSHGYVTFAGLVAQSVDESTPDERRAVAEAVGNLPNDPDTSAVVEALERGGPGWKRVIDLLVPKSASAIQLTGGILNILRFFMNE